MKHRRDTVWMYVRSAGLTIWRSGICHHRSSVMAAGSCVRYPANTLLLSAGVRRTVLRVSSLVGIGAIPIKPFTHLLFIFEDQKSSLILFHSFFVMFIYTNVFTLHNRKGGKMESYEFNRLLNENKDKTIVLTNNGQNITIEWYEDSWILHAVNGKVLVLFDQIDCVNYKDADLLFKRVVVANIDVREMEVVE